MCIWLLCKDWMCIQCCYVSILFHVKSCCVKWCDFLNSMNWLEEQLCSALPLIILWLFNKRVRVCICSFMGLGLYNRLQIWQPRSLTEKMWSTWGSRLTFHIVILRLAGCEVNHEVLSDSTKGDWCCFGKMMCSWLEWRLCSLTEQKINYLHKKDLE